MIHDDKSQREMHILNLISLRLHSCEYDEATVASVFCRVINM